MSELEDGLDAYLKQLITARYSKFEDACFRQWFSAGCPGTATEMDAVIAAARTGLDIQETRDRIPPPPPRHSDPALIGYIEKPNR